MKKQRTNEQVNSGDNWGYCVGLQVLNLSPLTPQVDVGTDLPLKNERPSSIIYPSKVMAHVRHVY